MADETPLLNELEKGPWPSYVKEIKRAAKKKAAKKVAKKKGAKKKATKKKGAKKRAKKATAPAGEGMG